MFELTPLPFEVDGGFGHRARLGLIVLETDQTLEAEVNSLNVEGVAIYHSRIPMAPEVSTDSLSDMLERLPAAARLLPSEFEFDAVGYACTSAATVIGAERVAKAIRTAHPGIKCTDPITAAIAGFKELCSKRVAVVTPYVAAVTQQIVDVFNNNQLEVSAAGTFSEPSDFVVGRISPESIANAVRTVVNRADCDAVFVSCTSLRSFGIIDKLESELGIPVLSSNQAFLWHLLRLAGVNDYLPGLGSLFRHGLGSYSADPFSASG